MLNLENLRLLNPDRFTKKEIALKASEFLRKYFNEYESEYSSQPIVPIEDIIDLRLGIDLSPWVGLQSKSGIYSDAFLEYHAPPRRSVIHFDHQYTEDDISYTRYRFTLAHEVAHWHLHSHVYNCVVGDEIEEPIDFYERYQALSDNCRMWIDRQANWFANDLLIPSYSLKHWFIEVIESCNEHIGNLLEEEKGEGERKEIVKEFLAVEIGKRFEVSKDAAKIAIDSRDDLIDTYWDKIIDL